VNQKTVKMLKRMQGIKKKEKLPKYIKSWWNSLNQFEKEVIKKVSIA
jgi:hypothetical protein